MTCDLVHVVDDDRPIRESLALLLRTEGFDVHLYPSAKFFLDQKNELVLGCMLIDVRLPGIDGLELLRRLRAAGYMVPVVMMTGYGNVPLAVEAMKLGACDFIEKPFDDETLIWALRSALRRGGADAAANFQTQKFLQNVAALTPRERQVFDYMIVGFTNKEISKILGISSRTVEIHRSKVMIKTKSKSFQDLVRCAVLAELADRVLDDRRHRSTRISPASQSASISGW